MSFTKAIQLLRLADMSAATYQGVSLRDIVAEFGCDHRTAQRMVRALEEVFPNVESREDPERRRYWRLPRVDQRSIHGQGIRDSELAALEMAAKRAEREGAPDEARHLRALRDRVLASMPSSHARRTEADAEALLEAQGFASRPGPRVVDDLRLLGTLTEALRAPWEVEFRYRSANDTQSEVRVVAPYGLLLGIRRYLVAQPKGQDGSFRRYRLDRIEEARITGTSFARDPDFDLTAYAAQSFGSFHSEAEYQETVWRFAPKAADTARQFVFHPAQQLEDEADGSLIVRFRASGWLEMTWYLYQWGDQVEVLAPAPLREQVARFRRADFPALP